MRKIPVEFNLSVSIFKEGKQFVAYSSALDLSTAGKDYKEVKRRFEEVVTLFFEEIVKKDTWQEALRELGWKKAKKVWAPPVVVAHEFEEFKIPLPV